MKRDLVRAVVNGMLLAGLIGFCAEVSPASVPGKPYSRRSVRPAMDRTGQGEVPMGKNLGSRNLSSTDVQSQSDARRPL